MLGCCFWFLFVLVCCLLDVVFGVAGRFAAGLFRFGVFSVICELVVKFVLYCFALSVCFNSVALLLIYGVHLILLCLDLCLVLCCCD